MKIPSPTAIRPYPQSNEVGWLRLLESHPTIHVPKVFAYNVGSGLQVLDESVLPLLPSNLNKDDFFLAMTKIEGRTLDVVWTSLTEGDKMHIVHQIADLILDLAEVTKGQISSLDANMNTMPPTELPRYAKGRLEMYSHEHWNIGPYDDVFSHAAATLSREIVFLSGIGQNGDMSHGNISESKMTKELTKMQEDHICQMRELRDAIIAQSRESQCSPIDFHGVHGDLAGRNIMITRRDDATGSSPFISGILDFEWANFYHISEIIADSVLVMEVYDDEDKTECHEWSEKIEQLVINKAHDRGWTDVGITELSRGGYHHLDSFANTSDLDPEGPSNEENSVETEDVKSGDRSSGFPESESRQIGIMKDALAAKLNPRKLAALASGAVDHDLCLAYYFEKS